MPLRSVLDDALPPLADTGNVVDISTGKPLSPPPTPVKPSTHMCCTPGHEDRPGRLTAGGPFCPDCLEQRAAARR